MKPAPASLARLARDITVLDLDDAIRAISMASDGGVAHWASHTVLVLCDALTEAGCGAREWSRSPPSPAHLGADWPSHGNYVTLRRHLWWLQQGWLPDPWSQEDADRETVRCATTNSRYAVDAAKQRLRALLYTVGQ